MSIVEIDTKYDWSEWRDFPDPRKNDYIVAPFGAGVYQLRNRRTGEFILFGEGKNLAKRMISLLPPPHGSGTRYSAVKRTYVLQNISDMEYRTVPCRSKQEAQLIQRELKALRIHRFNT